ncbi:5'-nucleotidase, partial [Achromatium sp. WMS2]
MNMSRREFVRILSLAGIAGIVPTNLLAAGASAYAAPKFGSLRLLHITDTHAQLNPIYFREPSMNLGIGPAAGKIPHLVGKKLLQHFNIQPNTKEAYAFSYLDFAKAATVYGTVGGFAHLKTLIEQMRTEAGPGNSLLLDGGDTWQGSGTAYWTRGQDMVQACNLLGVDIMTGHWEFTYNDTEVIRNIQNFKGEFVAHNIQVRDEALFDYRLEDFRDFNPDTGRAFKPYTIREVAGAKIAIIGQAFPYTPIANPQRFIP